MADQFADARGIVVAGKARAGAGDRPGLGHLAPYRDQPFGRGADHGTSLRDEQAGERCRVGRAQACVQRRRRQRRAEARLPGPRDVGLEHVSGTQVVQHAFHAGGEARRVILVDGQRRLPGRQRRQRHCRRHIGDEAFEQWFLPRFDHGETRAVAAVAQQRRRTAQRQRGRQAIGAHRQRQHRLHLRRQFVVQQQRPAAAKRRRSRRGHVDALRSPCGVQRFQEAAGDRRAAQVANPTICLQAQAAAVGHQQQVPAPMLGAGGGGFVQRRIAPRREAMQRQQVGIGAQGSNEGHRPGVMGGCAVARLSLPASGEPASRKARIFILSPSPACGGKSLPPRRRACTKGGWGLFGTSGSNSKSPSSGATRHLPPQAGAVVPLAGEGKVLRTWR